MAMNSKLLFNVKFSDCHSVLFVSVEFVNEIHQALDLNTDAVQQIPLLPFISHLTLTKQSDKSDCDLTRDVPAMYRCI